jgi:hypothetical protein
MNKIRIVLFLGLLALFALPICAQANDCAVTYDPATNTLKIPCFNYEGTVYDVDVGLIDIEVKDFSVEGDCLTNADCDTNQYCAKADGDCAGVGTCEAKPENCVLILMPVIGCDGETYGNFCDANREGINVFALDKRPIP